MALRPTGAVGQHAVPVKKTDQAGGQHDAILGARSAQVPLGFGIRTAHPQPQGPCSRRATADVVSALIVDTLGATGARQSLIAFDTAQGRARFEKTELFLDRT